LESALTYQPYLNKILHLPFYGHFYGHGQIYGQFLNKQENLKKIIPKLKQAHLQFAQSSRALLKMQKSYQTNAN
jgi:hypothetical protein